MLLESVKPLAKTKTSACKCLSIQMPETPLATPKDSGQVIWNLLSNAIKFTHPNGNVKIELGQSDAQVKIAKDDGIDRIDHEFWRAFFDQFIACPDNAQFWVVWELAYRSPIVVEMHNGTIEVYSEGLNSERYFTSFYCQIKKRLCQTLLNHKTTPVKQKTFKHTRLNSKV